MRECHRDAHGSQARGGRGPADRDAAARDAGRDRPRLDGDGDARPAGRGLPEPRPGGALRRRSRASRTRPASSAQSAQTLAPGGEGALENFDPAFPGKGATAVATLGADFPAPGSPSYRMDPAASDPDRRGSRRRRPIRYMGRGELCPGWVMSMTVGSVHLGRSALGHPRGGLGPRRRQRGDPGHGRELPPVQLRRSPCEERIAASATRARRTRCEPPPRPIASTASASLRRSCSLLGVSLAGRRARTTPRSSRPRSRPTCC